VQKRERSINCCLGPNRHAAPRVVFIIHLFAHFFLCGGRRRFFFSFRPAVKRPPSRNSGERRRCRFQPTGFTLHARCLSISMLALLATQRVQKAARVTRAAAESSVHATLSLKRPPLPMFFCLRYFCWRRFFRAARCRERSPERFYSPDTPMFHRPFCVAVFATPDRYFFARRSSLPDALMRYCRRSGARKTIAPKILTR